MFDIEQAIIEWRRELIKSKGLSVDNIEELESHLRDDIDCFSIDHHPDKAFRLALANLGEKQPLINEYKKNTGLSPRDIKLLKVFYSLFIILPIICLATIWFYMQGGPRFFHQFKNVISLTGIFSNYSYILLLSLLSAYTVISIRRSKFNLAIFSVPLLKATTFTLITCVLIYFVSIIPIFTYSNYPMQGRPFALFMIFGTLPLILLATLAVSRKFKSNTMTTARLNIFLGIFFYAAMYASQQSVGGAMLIFELIPITIVTILTICLTISFLPRNRQPI